MTGKPSKDVRHSTPALIACNCEILATDRLSPGVAFDIAVSFHRPRTRYISFPIEADRNAASLDWTPAIAA